MVLAMQHFPEYLIYFPEYLLYLSSYGYEGNLIMHIIHMILLL